VFHIDPVRQVSAISDRHHFFGRPTWR